MGKQHLEVVFQEKLAAKEKIFVPYIMAGDGGLNVLEERIHFLRDSGATAVEIGIPFSDPVADGPTIQAAGIRALNNGTTLGSVLETLQQFREPPVIPVILMTYLNPVFVYGFNQFAADCEKAGVTGVIIPDLPMEEEALVTSILEEKAIALIRLATLTSTQERLAEITKRTEGFLYAVAVAGTTGARANHEANVQDYLRELTRQANVPVLAGFGVSTPERARELSAACDGVVVGSKIVELFHKNELEKIQELVGGLNKEKSTRV